MRMPGRAREQAVGSECTGYFFAAANALRNLLLAWGLTLLVSGLSVAGSFVFGLNLAIRVALRQAYTSISAGTSKPFSFRPDSAKP
jgi:hypothetical protein